MRVCGWRSEEVLFYLEFLSQERVIRRLWTWRIDSARETRFIV